MIKKSIEYDMSGTITGVVTFDDAQLAAPLSARSIVVDGDVNTDSGKVNLITLTVEPLEDEGDTPQVPE
jgi:hypothetical protein